ncbi:MAG: Hsp20/alpha crystallin family protein [Dehalococcoidia bacterium]|nr:Hsp20/alpha crystallin family protein [Dehalococcoidia bacterium]
MPKQSAPLIPESVEPIVDIFDEGNRILVVAEVPGADEHSIRVELEDHTLKLSARGKFRDYRGEVALPGEARPDSLDWTLNNGVINLTLARENGKENGRRQTPGR